MQASDMALLARWTRDGDAEAFRQIASRHAGMVYGTCRRILRDAVEAEDAAQECFEALARARSGPRQHVAGWLHAVAVSKALNHLKSQRRRRDREFRYAAETPAAEEARQDDIYELVDEALAELPDALRTPIVLHFFEGQTHETIARDLGLTRTAVTHRIRKGIEQIRRALARRGTAVTAAALASALSAQAGAEAVPASLAAAVAKLALAGPAATGGAAAALTALGGALAIKGTAAVAVLVVVAAGAAYWVSRPEAPDTAAPPTVRYTQLAPETPPAPEAETPDRAAEKPASSPPPTAAAGAAPAQVETGAVTGRVYDASTGEPIQDIHVWLQPMTGVGSNAPGGDTDAEGRYRIENVPPGKRRAQYTGEGLMGLDIREAPVVEVKAGQLLEGLDFAVPRGMAIAGRVVDLQGHPVNDASVEAYTRSPERGLILSDRTGPDGLFEFHGIGKQDQVLITAYAQEEHEGDLTIKRLVSDHYGPMKVSDKSARSLAVVLYPSGSISGMVTTPDGRPLAGGSVLAKPEMETGGRGAERATIADNGAFTVKGLPAGSYALSFGPAGSRGWKAPKPPCDGLRLERSGRLAGIRVAFDPGLTITGRITDETGAPVRDAQVSCTGEGHPGGVGMSGDDGRYLIFGLKDTRYRVVVQTAYRQGPDGSSQFLMAAKDFPAVEPKEATGGATGVDFVLNLHGARKIEGRVVEAAGERPVAEFEALCLGGRERHENSEKLGFEPRRDPEGRFTIDNVPNVDATLFVRAPGFAEAEVPIPAPAPGKPGTPIVVRLEPGASLAGRVRDAEGNGIGNAALFLGEPPAQEQDRHYAKAYTDIEGRFRIDSLPLGTTQIAVMHPQYPARTEPVQLVQGRENTVEIVLQQAGVVEGTIYVGDEPKAGASLRLVGRLPQTQVKTATSDSSGGFRFEGLAAGVVTLTAHFSTGPDGLAVSSRGFAQTVEVIEGQTTTIDFRLPPGEAVVEGKVLRNGAPVPGAEVGLFVAAETGREERRAMTDTDGAYRFEQVPLGPAEAMAFDPKAGEVARAAFEVGTAAMRQDLEFGGGAVVEGRVQGFDGGQGGVIAFRGDVGFDQPLESALEQLMSTDPTVLAGQATLAPDGAYRLSGLAPGRYTLLAFAHAAPAEGRAPDPATVRTATQLVEIDADGSVSVDLSLR